MLGAQIAGVFARLAHRFALFELLTLRHLHTCMRAWHPSWTRVCECAHDADALRILYLVLQMPHRRKVIPAAVPREPVCACGAVQRGAERYCTMRVSYPIRSFCCWSRDWRLALRSVSTSAAAAVAANWFMCSWHSSTRSNIRSNTRSNTRSNLHDEDCALRYKLD